ncbi:hypothetical protein H4R18_001682 [Coemansia javaensis]|uniref:Myb-like domain-containing protein n=1 Tax=Coemansia javaensis TaxID=2761396 RepID=A0A9W8HGH5_9FUNG|nr:hypothetical protein H4R18_001682 [Coemansia javaensis]
MAGPVCGPRLAPIRYGDLNEVERVSKVANKCHDRRTGRCSWEAVSEELRVPVLRCLQLFDRKDAKIPQRGLLGSDVWPLEDVERLEMFTKRYFSGKEMNSHDWELVGKYMNIAPRHCISKMWAVDSCKLNPALYDSIRDLFRDGVLWPTIVELHSALRHTYDVVRFVYGQTDRATLKKQRRPKAQYSINKHEVWNDAEDRHLAQLLEMFPVGQDVDWNFVSKTVGHSKNACRYRSRRHRGAAAAKGAQPAGAGRAGGGPVRAGESVHSEEPLHASSTSDSGRSGQSSQSPRPGTASPPSRAARIRQREAISV